MDINDLIVALPGVALPGVALLWQGLAGREPLSGGGLSRLGLLVFKFLQDVNDHFFLLFQLVLGCLHLAIYFTYVLTYDQQVSV